MTVLGTAELARKLGTSRRTVQRWLARGWLETLPAPPGSPKRVSMEALQRRLKTLARRRQRARKQHESQDEDDFLATGAPRARVG